MRPLSSKRGKKRRRLGAAHALTLEQIPSWSEDGDARCVFTRRLLMTIYWMTSGCSYRELGNLFGERCGVHSNREGKGMRAGYVRYYPVAVDAYMYTQVG
jgi:hypothetical protein